MNKFFRLVSMFAIAGVTFAYTSCTDYSEDINKVDDRVDNLDGRLTTVEGQVKNLETATTDLKDAQAKTDAAVKTLETTLAELNTKHDKDINDLKKAYADADDALKSEIQGKIDALTTTHNNDVKNINAAIKALQDDMKALQEKADAVEKLLPTLATKKDLEEASQKTADAIAEINKTIGTLQGNLEVAQGNITALQTKVTTLEGDVADLKAAVETAQKAADAAQTAADNAQNDATLALGNIEALKKALGKYAEVGALEAKIALLDEMDATLEETKFDTKDFGEYFAKELKDVIGAYAEKGVLEAKLAALDSKDEDLQSQISKLDAKVDQKVADLEGKISDLDEKVEQYNIAVNNRINAVLGIIEGRLSSIAFVPEYYYDGVPAILFETIAYDPLADAKENEVAVDRISGDQNSISANVYKNFTSALAKAQYRLNPRTVGVECADFSFVGDKADYVFTRATAPAAPVSIVGAPAYDAATGYVTFSVKKNEKLNVTDNTNKNLDIVALKAVLKQGLTDDEAKAEQKPEVYSEYAHVNEIAYSAANLAISDKANLAAKKDHEYAKTFDAAAAQAPVYPMPYDKVFDLKTLVATCINTEIETPGLEAVQNHANLDLTKYDLTYSFSVAKTAYVVPSDETKTNQQTIIECVDAEKGLYKVIAASGVEYNKEAIGRTPIVRVDLKHGNNIVTRAFIKLIISVDKTYEPINVSDNNLDVVLACPDTKVTMAYDEEKLRSDVYRVLNIDHVSFWNIYQFDKAYVKKNGTEVTTITVPELKDGAEADGKATKKVVWNFTHGEVGKIGKGAKVEGYLVVKNTLDAYSEYPTYITFKFTVNFSLPTPEVTAEIKDIFWKDGVLQANVNRPESTTDVAENCWFNTPIAEQPWTKLAVKGLPCDEVPAFRIAEVYKNGVKSNYKGGTSEGIYISTYNGEVSIILDKDNKSIKQALNSEKGLQALVEWYAVAESGDVFVLHTFMVNFIRPVTMYLPEGLSVKDAVDGGDMITFGYDGLLKDWRGEVILPPTTTEVLEEAYYWNKVCSPADHALVVPAYQKVVKEGYYEFEYQDVDVVIPSGTSYYKASIQLLENAEVMAWYAKHDDNPWAYEKDGRGSWKKVYRPEGEWKNAKVVVAYGRSAGEAKENARAEANKLSTHYLDNKLTCGMSAEAPVVEVINAGSTSFSFRTISKVTYVPAEYEEVPAYIIYSDCNERPGPDDLDDYTVGQRIGCWEWQKYSWTEVKPVAGQYWDFYGEFSDVVLDLANNYKNVTTDLPDGKLPSGASLVQTGYTLKYENVQSPIQYSYHIFIPASIQYGWGVLNGTLTITVNPVSTIK